MSARRTGIGIVLFVLLSLASCSTRTDFSSLPRDRSPAGVDVSLQPDGTGRVAIRFSVYDPTVSPGNAIDVARIVFPQAQSVVIDEDGSYGSTLVLEAPNAFATGPAPSFVFRGQDIVERMAAAGYNTIDLSLCWPVGVPRRVTSSPPVLVLDGCVQWKGSVDGASIPDIAVAWTPEPWRWFAAVLGFLIAATAALASFWLAQRVRERRRYLKVAGLALVAILAGFVTLGIVTPDAMQITLELSGRASSWLALSRVLSVLVASAGIIAIPMAVVALGIARGNRKTYRRAVASLPARPDPA